MPFVQVSVPQGTAAQVKKDISLSIHESLMEAFNIPADDYFQVFREVSPAELFYPDSYMNISHTSNLIYVQIIARGGRTADMKKALYRGIAEKISSRTPISSNDIIIILVENTVENWSFGQGIAQYL